MKKILNIGVLVILFIAITVSATAQQVQTEKINIKSGEMVREGDSLYIHMIVDLATLKLDRNRTVTLSPMVTNDRRQAMLPDIVINGTGRHKAYLRSEALSGNTQSQNTVIKLDKKAKTDLHYRQVLPYQDWMENARLDVKEDLCGCGGHEQVIAMHHIAESTPEATILPYVFSPQLAYIQPKIEEVKTRSSTWETYLDFPVNKTTILPDYMGNPIELAKIENMLKAVRSDNNVSVTRIDITGYASPEGLVAANEKLAQGRAESFKKYLSSKLDFSSDVYKVQYGGENWDGLSAAVEASTMNDKEAILDIIKNTNDLATRKTKLKTLNNGIPYQQMLKEIYPDLRKVESKAYYTVKGFASVDEAKEIMKSRPQQLSLEEMFRISSTYQAGSNDFIDVFETAVRMFPNDETANLNAAAAALSVNNVANAEKYLKKSNTNSPEYANNLGALYLLIGEQNKAREQFVKASANGLKAAEYNLKEIDKKIANDSQIQK